jgi:hypothetical protein
MSVLIVSMVTQALIESLVHPPKRHYRNNQRTDRALIGVTRTAKAGTGSRRSKQFPMAFTLSRLVLSDRRRLSVFMLHKGEGLRTVKCYTSPHS